MDLPDRFLEARDVNSELASQLSCICPGFELKQWRYERLAGHLIDWLPDFAIRQDQLPEAIRNTTDVRKLTEQSVERIYKTRKSDLRGEIGELLLHIICRQFSGTFPAVSKIFYKDSSNNVVKGFDLVHTRYNQPRDDLELWLGEAKFYKSATDAVTDAARSIRKHLEAGFLTSEKLLISNKISRDTPGYSQLKKLFDADTSLDEIFRRLIIPVLIAFDCKSTATYVDDDSYNEALSVEIAKLQQSLSSKLPADVSFFCFYFPMATKESLITHFDRRLSGYR